MSRALSVAGIQGEVLADATLTATQMAQMNFAREEYKKLFTLLDKVVLPAMGDRTLPVCQDVRRHLEQIHSFSGGFCYSHRHLGISHNAKAVQQ